ncbi:transposase [Noviherbaspirillum aerium]|uniref:transposase n=1 Tax=Noviherbaspirillum aerium TaxID=2588497 RepID=UPI00384D404B
MFDKLLRDPDWRLRCSAYPAYACAPRHHSEPLATLIKHSLVPRRWVVERSFARAVCFRRLARDYERMARTLDFNSASPAILLGICRSCGFGMPCVKRAYRKRPLATLP